MIWAHAFQLFAGLEKKIHLAIFPQNGLTTFIGNSKNDTYAKGIKFPDYFLNITTLGTDSGRWDTPIVDQKLSNPEAEYTDFNVWDRAFTKEEAEDWTACR